MAKIQIIDIPAAPKGDAAYLGEARGGEISMPGVRYQEATSFEKHIPGLMQPELSRAPYDALARAQSGIGTAIADVGQGLASTAMNLAAGMKASKDASDLSFANNQMRLQQAAFAEEVANNNIQPAQQLELWQKDYVPKINQALVDRNMSPDVAAEIIPKWQLFNAQQRSGIAQEAQKELIKAQETEILNDIEGSAASGDWAGALDANARLTIGGHQTKGQEEKRKRDILDAKQQWDLGQDMADNPRMVLEEMEEIERTGKSDIYPELQNPIIVARAKDAARKEINDREVDTLGAIQDAKGAGKLIKPEDIDRIAQGNLTSDKVASLKNELLHDPKYDKQRVVEMRTKITGYSAEDDDEALTKFHTLYEEIGTTVPQDIQGILRSDLSNEYRRKKEGKEKDRAKTTGAATDALILDYARAGLLDSDGYQARKAQGADREAYIAKNPQLHGKFWSKIETYQIRIREWAKEHPDAMPDEVLKKLDEMIGLELRANAKKETDWKKYFPSFRLNSMPPVRVDRMGGTPPADVVPLTPAQIKQKIQPQQEAGQGNGLSDSLIQSVKRLEGFASKSQWDFKQWSIGYGTKGREGETITEAQADARLRAELATHARIIDAAVTAAGMKLTGGQRNALISFDFNTGKGEFLIRTSNGNVGEILRRLKLYIKAGGKELPGLVSRRKAEAEMFSA